MNARPSLWSVGRSWLGTWPSTAARCLGAAYAIRDFFSIAPCTVREGEPAVPLAVAVLVHPERRGRLRVPLLPLQDLRLVGFADLGRDHVQDPFAQDPQRFRVVLGGVPDQRGLRLVAQISGSRSSGRASIAAMITSAWSTSSSPVGQRDRGPAHEPRVASAVASLVLRCAPARVCLVGVCPPVRRRGGATVGFDLDRLTVRGTRASSSASWASSEGDLDHRLAGLRRAPSTRPGRRGRP